MKVGVSQLLGVSHATLGATGGLVAGAATEAPFTMKCVMAAVGAFGGLLSDADTESSILGRFLPKFWHKLTPGHRRITHSLPYVAVVFLVAYGCQVGGASLGLWGTPQKSFVPIALTAGVLTHLLADGMTDQGVPLFYPLWRKHFRLLGPFSFTTGTPTERIAVLVLTSLAGGYIFRPLAKWLTGGVFDSLAVAGVHIGSLLIFVITVAVCASLLVLYSLSRSGKPHRRNGSTQSKAKRKPSSTGRTRPRTKA